MWPWKKRKPELIPVPTHGPVKLEPIPRYRSLVAYASRVIHARADNYPPFVVTYDSLRDELYDRLKWKTVGMVIAYRVTVKPKAA